MMSALRRTWNRLLGSVGRGAADADIAVELESHIEMLAEEHIRRGIPPQEAHRRARLQLGSVESVKESYRDQRGLPALDAIVRDLRYAGRAMRKRPGFAAVVILSLAIGIAANTAIFSLVNAVLLQPLPFKDPHRIFGVGGYVNPMQVRAWAQECSSIEQAALMDVAAIQVDAGGEPVSISGALVSHNIFALFEITPILGRAFLADEEQEGADRVVMLSESLWRSRFNGDPSMVGRMIRVDGENRQVVGIVPESFRLPKINTTNTRFDVYRPLVLQRDEIGRLTGNYNYSGLIRLKPDVAAEQAVAEIKVVQARIKGLTGTLNDMNVTLVPVIEYFTRQARVGLWMLSAAVGAVLLIVCINLANLLLSRVASRGREAAIRTALGASRGRQFRQSLTESLTLAFIGGGIGVLFANWLLQLFVSATTLDIPRLDEARLDSTVLLFALGITLLTGLVFGVLPAWRSAGRDPQEALRAGSHTITEGRRGMRIRHGMIALEIGLSTALLIVAALLGVSLTRLLNVDKGFDLDRVLTVDISLPGAAYADTNSRLQFFDRLLARVSAIPGVQASAITTQLPTRGQSWTDPIYLEGAAREERRSVNNRYVGPEYFRAMNISVLAGRAFAESDRGQDVALLSEKAAGLLWPGEGKVVGRRFIGEDDKPKTLVGLVAEVRASLASEAPPTAYYPYWQRVPAGAALVIRTTGEEAAVGLVRAALRSEDAQLAIPAIRTMEEVVDSSVAQRRFQSTLMSVFAASALLVACLGIYGVVSYSIVCRRNEIGIRLALGAQRSRLLGSIVRQGMAPVVVGLAGGVAIGLALAQTIRGLLFEVEPMDPMTIAGVTALLLLVGSLACFIPARRAASTDVIATLRFD